MQENFVTSQQEPIMVLVSCANTEEAKNIAQNLLDKRLVACAQVGSQIDSMYRWEGQIETAQEVLLQLKTFRALWGELEKEILSMHSYSVPEILAVPILEISHYYYVWMMKELLSEK